MLLLITSLLLALVLSIETFVWYVRAMAMPSARSKVISTSNIVMYITRVLLALYQLLINYQIETGSKYFLVYQTLFGGISLAVAFNLIFLNQRVLKFIWRIFVRVTEFLRISNSLEYKSRLVPVNFTFKVDFITIASFFSAFAMITVYVLPQILAVHFYEFRLTFTSVGQFLSFIGMIITLFILDPKLFSLHDSEGIAYGFSSYLQGRLLLLLLVSMLSFIFIFIGI